MRWHHPTRGMISPGMFIPLAEESGLIVPMGEWVMREACREAASWPKPLQIAINLSPVQFRHGDLAGLMHSILLESGLSPHRLEVEITESVLMENSDVAAAAMARLAALGVRLDDLFETLQIQLGSYYVNNFNRFGRSWQVNLQADAGHRGDIRSLFDRACPENVGDLHRELGEFLQGRLKALLVAEGYATDLVEAVLATSGMDLVHDAERVRALGALARAGAFDPIRITFRRAAGLVKEHGSSAYDVAGLTAAVEMDLHHALQQLPDGLSVPAMLEALTGLRPVVDRFFEGVLVMSDDPVERANRLGLLKAVTLKFSSLADFTRLSSE